MVIASLIGRRWGTRAAGLVAGLPVIAGPLLLVLVLTKGVSFGATAATGALVGLVALACFVATYAHLSSTTSPALSLAVGWLAFLGVAVGLETVSARPITWLLVAYGSFAVLLHWMPIVPEQPEPIEFPRWDISVRAAVALAMVVVVAEAASALGPTWSGILSSFPIIGSVLTTFTHRRGGAHHVKILARAFVAAYFGFAAFCFALSETLLRIDTGLAFGIALASALAAQVCVAGLAARRRPAHRREPATHKQRPR